MKNETKMYSGKSNVLMTILIMMFFSFALNAQVKVIQNQNVGIGTSEPSEKLEVVGAIKSTVKVNAPLFETPEGPAVRLGASANAPFWGYTFSVDPNKLSGSEGWARNFGSASLGSTIVASTGAYGSSNKLNYMFFNVDSDKPVEDGYQSLDMVLKPITEDNGNHIEGRLGLGTHTPEGRLGILYNNDRKQTSDIQNVISIDSDWGEGSGYGGETNGIKMNFNSIRTNDNIYAFRLTGDAFGTNGRLGVLSADISLNSQNISHNVFDLNVSNEHVGTSRVFRNMLNNLTLPQSTSTDKYNQKIYGFENIITALGESNSGNHSYKTKYYGIYSKLDLHGGTKRIGYNLYLENLGDASDFGIYQKGDIRNYFDGALGIGTEIPSEKLEVSGSAKISERILQGDGQVRIGENCGKGLNSIYIGENAGEMSSLTAYNNVAIGSDAARSNLGGDNNISIGHDAASKSTGGGYKIALGANTLENCDGSENIALGRYTAQSLVGTKNFCVGYIAGRNLEGDNNVILSGGSELKGSNNFGSGSLALRNATCDYAVAIGYSALRSSNLGAERQIGLGYKAGSNGDGNDVIYIGTNSGIINSGDNNIFIGKNAGNAVAHRSVNNTLIIDSADNTTDAKTPLIYGKFDTDELDINGALNIKSTSTMSALLTLEPTTEPAGAADGTIYFGTDDKIHVRVNGQWKTLAFDE